MSITLKRTGHKMPIVGLGLWKIPKDVCADTVYTAIKEGYRLLDGACDYGNEKEAGEGVARAIKEGIITRKDIFITSKLWNTFHAHAAAKDLVKRQLKLWGLEYFDLFLVHFPISLEYVDPDHRFPPEWFNDEGKVSLGSTPLSECWGAMEEMVYEGLAKNIGLSNCQGSILYDLHNYAKIEPQVLQVELHPYLTQEPLVEYAKLLGIAVTTYSSFGPASWIEINADQGAQSLFTHNTVVDIAKAHGKTSAQVLLRWSTQRGLAVIPKSTDLDKLRQNLNSTGFELSEKEIKAISGLNANLRLNDPRYIDPRMSIFA